MFKFTHQTPAFVKSEESHSVLVGIAAILALILVSGLVVYILPEQIIANKYISLVHECLAWIGLIYTVVYLALHLTTKSESI